MILIYFLVMLSLFHFNKCISKNIQTKHYSKKINIPQLFNAKTKGQKVYKKALYDPNNHLIVCNGPAGSGKTCIACDYSIHNLKLKNYKKIIITRPTVTIQEDLGYLPGTINEKMHPWTLPIFDIFHEYYSKSEIEVLIKDGIIEISPLGFMQGRTFKDSIIIADEMQNSSIGQMFMLLTRIGHGSKMIINGDLNQNKWNENSLNNGLKDLIEKINNKKIPSDNDDDSGIELIELDYEDIVRHPLVSKIISIYQS